MRKTLAAVAIAIAAGPMPATAQTLLDKVIQRVTARRTVPATAMRGASAQQPAGDAEMAASAFPLDVAGVRLGMSASEARAALVKAGYAMPATSGVSYGPSFAARVRAEAARRRTGAGVSPTMTDRVTTRLQGVGPNRESITVGLTAAPAGGSIVTDVHLTMPQDVMRGDAFLRQVTEKYGRPDGGRDQGMTLAWCSPPLKSVCGSIAPFQRRPEALPNLTASVIYNDNTIRLHDGTDQDRERERTYAAAVERAAPKTDRAAF
jgi:hypothetical protein